MAQRTIWDSMVTQVGVRKARRLAAFVECWSLSDATPGSPPAADHLADEWGFTTGEVSYWLKQYRHVFLGERDPTRLARSLPLNTDTSASISFATRHVASWPNTITAVLCGGQAAPDRAIDRLACCPVHDVPSWRLAVGACGDSVTDSALSAPQATVTTVAAAAQLV